MADSKTDNDAVLFLLQKYKNIVKAKARSYFLPGADRDDLIQEGMIGLFKAVRDFDITKNSNFRSFAELCVTRQIISAVKSAARKKHFPLNSYISLNSAKPANENSGRNEDALALTEENDLSPEEIIIDKESNAMLENDLNAILTTLEKNTLNLYLNGKTYNQIAKLLSKNKKSVDNALKRAKLKINKYYASKN